MIKNDRQLTASEKQLLVLREGLIKARQINDQDVFAKAHLLSLETDIEALEHEIAEFNELRASPVPLAELEKDLQAIERVSHMGRDLVRIRISHQISQKLVAEAAGKAEQAIQRLEDDEYAGANVDTLRDIGRALLVIVTNSPKRLARV